MKEEISVSENVRPEDIVFNCPQCTKSLAIDPRAAGFTITCPDCGTEVQVPETVGALAENLEDTVLALRSRLNALEKRFSLDQERLAKITQEMGLIQAALDRTVSLLQDALEPFSEDAHNGPIS
jgi:predicted RNA-binding Zn-ribbon protein involved in translation (DUF1610 family)